MFKTEPPSEISARGLATQEGLSPMSGTIVDQPETGTGLRKNYYVLENVGKARHVVNFHDGVKTHEDGSPFYDIHILSNKRDRDAFVKDLRSAGYVHRDELSTSAGDTREENPSRVSGNQHLTYRERRERRAERLREWAGKREARAQSDYERSRELADVIPFGQPVLVGHYSQRGHEAQLRKIDSAMRHSVENDRKAEDMRSRAENIEAQNRAAIYSDDPDAKERLIEKIARLEAQRDEMKRRNAEYRKAHRDELKGLSAYQRDRALPHQGYEITNMTQNIGRLRKRLEQLDRPPVDRVISARFDSSCADCGADLKRGDQIRYNKQQGARCMECRPTAQGVK